jgi:hypothetical protein
MFSTFLSCTNTNAPPPSAHRDLFNQPHHSNLSTAANGASLDPLPTYLAAHTGLKSVKDSEGREKILPVNLIQHLLSACYVQDTKLETLSSVEIIKSYPCLFFFFVWKLFLFFFYFFFFFIFLLLFICAYKAWFISPPCPHPLPYHPLHPLLLPPQYPAETILPLSLILL